MKRSLKAINRLKFTRSHVLFFFNKLWGSPLSIDPEALNDIQMIYFKVRLRPVFAS